MIEYVRRLPAGFFVLAAGILYALYHYYDWIVMERLMNTGYPEKHAPDFALFLAPLCFGYGALRLYRGADGRRSRSARVGIRIVVPASVVLSAAWFFAMWIYHSDIPWFVLLFFPGSLAMSVGLLLLPPAFRSPVVRAALAFLSVATIAYPIAPQLVAASEGLRIASEWKFALGLSLGVVTAAFGGYVLLRKDPV